MRNITFAIAFIGIVLVFITSCKKDDSSNGNLTDSDGNVYHIVTIGTQVWMVENLQTTHLNDGTSLQIANNNQWEYLTSPATCTYNNTSDSSIISKYGRLYNWYAVNTGKLCLSGWHVPTDDDWTTLENYLIANGYNYDATTTENKIAKAMAAATGWSSSSKEGVPGNTDYPAYINKSGFSALPAGYCSLYGIFTGLNEFAIWWSSTEQNEANAYYRALNHGENSDNRGYGDKTGGFSVRCLRD